MSRIDELAWYKSLESEKHAMTKDQDPFETRDFSTDREQLDESIKSIASRYLKGVETLGARKEPQPVPEEAVKPSSPPAPPIPQARPALSTLVSPIFHPARFLPSTSINYMIQLQAAAESEHSLESFALDVAATAQKLGFQVTIMKG